MPKMDFQKKGFLILLIVFILFFVVLVLPAIVETVEIRRQPVQNVQVEVVGKRTTRTGRRRGPAYFNYIVAFRLPDGTEKELQVLSASPSISPVIFDNLQEGDTGTLSFQEHKNISKWKDTDQWEHRRFISFEKDEP